MAMKPGEQSALVRPEDMTDHPYLPDRDGHNCLVCSMRDDALHLCWSQAHPAPDRQHEWFVRQVVETISRYQDDGKGLSLTPEEKVTAAMRTTYSMEEAGPMVLDEEGAVWLAAIIVAGSSWR